MVTASDLLEANRVLLSQLRPSVDAQVDERSIIDGGASGWPLAK